MPETRGAERRNGRAKARSCNPCAAPRARIIGHGGKADNRRARAGKRKRGGRAKRGGGHRPQTHPRHEARGQGREKFSRPTRSRASESERATRATRPTGPTSPPAVKKNRPQRGAGAKRRAAGGRRERRGARGGGKGTGGRERADLNQRTNQPQAGRARRRARARHAAESN